MASGHLDALLLQNILRSIDEGIHVIDHKGCTVYYNESMERIEGLKKENVLGRHVLEVFPNLTRETSTLMKALERGMEIDQDRQSYLNHKGQRITSINVTLPIKDREKVLGAIEIARNITDVNRMSEQLADLQMKLFGKSDRKDGAGRPYVFKDILGEDAGLQRMIRYAEKSSVNDSSVFIYGETGTGKEMFAQSIHSASPRRKGPFIAQNCAALPESLLEGILFGTEKGGFTGAIERPGLFEQSDGGTLFLDEINSMSTHLQAKILRVLQESTVRRIGGLEDIPINVRIIAASNEKPETAMDRGTLRKDLFYRVNVIGIHLPPLRARRGDLELLTRHFITHYNRRYNKNVQGVSPAVEAFFKRYDWPGNVRELKNILESAMNICGSDIIGKEDLPDYFRWKPVESPTEPEGDLNSRLRTCEREWIHEALERSGGNVTQASALLGISRQNLQYKLRKYGL